VTLINPRLVVVLAGALRVFVQVGVDAAGEEAADLNPAADQRFA
jgi:hypothetical protein